jgi:threonine dehydrogenase-like Zn-dependent dehydrogenase
MAKFQLALISILVASASAFMAPRQHAVRSTQLMMTTETGREPIKVGVIGCGRIGIVHLGAINKAPGVIPVIVSNPTVSKAEDGKILVLYVLCHKRKFPVQFLLILLLSYLLMYL